MSLCPCPQLPGIHIIVIHTPWLGTEFIDLFMANGIQQKKDVSFTFGNIAY